MRAQYFEFSPKVLNSHLTAAFLWVHVRSNSLNSGNSSPDNSVRDRISGTSNQLLRKAVDKSKKKSKEGDKKTAWVVVYQISKINRESGRPELVHVSVRGLCGRTCTRLTLPDSVAGSTDQGTTGPCGQRQGDMDQSGRPEDGVPVVPVPQR